MRCAYFIDNYQRLKSKNSRPQMPVKVPTGIDLYPKVHVCNHVPITIQYTHKFKDN